MESNLPEAELERAYDLIAAAIDRAGRERESLFLAKLCLALGAQLQRAEQIEEAIRIAEEELQDG